MEACFSCDGMVDAATRQCSRCGRAQPEPCAAESGSPSGGRDDGQAEAGTGRADSHRRPGPSAAGKVTEPSAASVTAEPAARPIEQAAAEEERPGDGKPLRKIFHDRRINLKDRHLASSPLRLLIYAAFAQTVIVALLLLGGLKVSQPSVSSGVADQAGGTFLVPTAVFIVMATSVAAGYCLVLAGALRVRAAAGLPIVAATTITLAVVPISTLHAGAAIEPHEWLRWAQLGVLGLLWAWVLWRLATRQWPGGAEAEHGSSGERKHGAVLVGVLAAVVAYYAVEFVVWGSYAQAGQTARGTGFLLDDLSFQAVLLPVFLTLVVLLGSTDLLGWGELIAARVRARATPSHSWIFLILTPLAACLVIANALHAHPGEALPELLVGAVLAGIVGLLVRLGTGYTGWSDDLRGKLVFVGVILVFVYMTVFSNITEELAMAAGLSSLVDKQLYWLISTPILLVLLTVGLFLVARGQVGKRKRNTGPTGLFLAMVGILILIVELPEFVSLKSRKLPWVIPWQQFSLLSGIQLAAGTGALVWIGWLLAHKRLSKKAVGPLPSIFLLLVGLGLVTLIIDLLQGIEELGNHSAFALAGFFLLITLWGLITSGDQLNKASAHYPRDGRIMLFVGYTFIANATLVFLGTLRVPVTGTGPPEFLTSDYVSPAGVGILGTALVVMAFIMRPRELARSSAPAAASRAEATPAKAIPATAGAGPATRDLNPVIIQRGILGAGALVTAVALIFVGVSAAPHLANVSAQLVSQPYRAFVPVRGKCDEGGASWTVPPGDPITTNCVGKIGLQVEAAHPGAGDIQLLLPGGPFPGNYRVSVQVNLRHMPDGCASIYTRASAAGHYSSYICTNTLNGAQVYVWGIQEIGSKMFKQLGSGIVRKANVYVLEATAANTIQQITVDGSSAAFTNGALAATEFVSLGISDSGKQGGSVIFSNFTFTPLAAQPRLSPSTALTPLPALPPPSAGASAAPSAASIKDQVSAWFVNGGQAELDLLAARVHAVGLATTTYAALGKACSALATAVRTAQADPPIPDPAAQVWLTKALNEFGKAAAICATGSASHSLAVVNEAAVPMHTATTDIKQVWEVTGND